MSLPKAGRWSVEPRLRAGKLSLDKSAPTLFASLTRIHVWFYHPRRDMEELLAAQGIKRSDTGSNPADKAPHHSEEKDRPKNDA